MGLFAKYIMVKRVLNAKQEISLQVQFLQHYINQPVAETQTKKCHKCVSVVTQFVKYYSQTSIMRHVKRNSTPCIWKNSAQSQNSEKGRGTRLQYRNSE